MKQRLGIALALLADPKLIILDEPTNGLDPNGIIEVRQLLMRLVKEEGKTVFVSSHLLAEIERMATHVGIINHGELVFQGSIEELSGLSKPLVQVELADSVDAANLLKRSGYTVSDVQDNNLFIPYISKEETGKINTLLNQNGYVVYSIGKVQKDLENLFLDITQNT
jgi:ABC-type multidrug transport system ATPase subunit